MSYGKLAKGISEKEARMKLQKVMPASDRAKDFNGASPPSVFVGSHGYPKVSAGILSPQHPGDSRLFDSPGKWKKSNYSIERIASLRTSLVNSKKQFKVKEADSFLDDTKEVAMARKPVDLEVSLEKKPGQSITGGRAKPVSASGDVKKLTLGENPSVERKLEDMFYDTDAKSETAVEELYSSGVSNYDIQQSFSVGMLGEEQNRKLVPTRWSITATDDMISKQLRDSVRTNQELGEIRYFQSSYVGNNFHVFLIPGNWEFELIELKKSGSVWNSMKNTYIAQNYEPATGRKNYAEETAGAYYASRLSALEYLNRINRRAKVLIVRDVTPEYWAPLGVWVIREAVRDAFGDYRELESMRDVKQNISDNFRFLYSRIENCSKLMGSRQQSLSYYGSS
ncbi:hypothetical protein [Candidatus Nanohalococcus occultus]|uniref:hypothetical protein n=1 Tax=Candidatus Nanohalococcus occultus TaxID=2978047 RepID=UPI0039E058F3